LTAVTDPAAVVTTTSFEPEVPLGVVIVRDVAVFEFIVAATPPMVTEVALDRLVPVIVTEVPPAVTPEVTLSDVIVGGGLYE
jgi:6,7-dimethyl-8-ribityllumazine synthase